MADPTPQPDDASPATASDQAGSEDRGHAGNTNPGVDLDHGATNNPGDDLGSGRYGARNRGGDDAEGSAEPEHDRIGDAKLIFHRHWLKPVAAALAALGLGALVRRNRRRRGGTTYAGGNPGGDDGGGGYGGSNSGGDD